MPTSRVILVLYAFIATTNVMASAIANDSLFWATKPLLMPLLAGVVIFAGVATRSLVAALCAATVGDVFLMIDGSAWFYAGMAAFAIGHACYLVAFARAGAWRRLRRAPLVAVPVLYALVVVAAEIVLRLPVPILLYGCLLAAMAASAAGLGWRAGLGGALFLLSDLLKGTELSGIDLGGTELPGPPIWVMLTYVLGQALIVLGWLHRHEGTAAPAIPNQRARTTSDEEVRAE